MAWLVWLVENIVYIDNICIFSKIKKEYINHVRQILDRLRQYRLYIKFSKCEFSKEEIQFLNFIVGRNGIRIDSVKINTIMDWKSPGSFREI